MTGYIAWLHILVTTPLDDEERTGVVVTRPAKRGEDGHPARFDCSAMPIDRPPR